MTGKGNKVQKEMWNWEWKKAKPVGKDEKEATPATNEPEVPEAGEESKYQYPLICMSEIPKQFETEMMDTIMSAVDRFTTDLPKACQYIKQEFDRLYEPLWHCVIGQSYGFDVTYDQKSIMYMFYLGNLAILVWKFVTF
ncbi:dynein light chain LC6, flagellar outer arm [Folsomia candida]|uniref:Dynein light chain n=1 Tax=Folsomia candida TaxID=158441 RepID=A0A226D6I0_FOLCA|nr:dynein light chain LC6, flagellar outer arm [Folsomia candida]OXA40468.1 Dynein light chain 4, axonemal [Folsomia candida]